MIIVLAECLMWPVQMSLGLRSGRPLQRRDTINDTTREKDTSRAGGRSCGAIRHKTLASKAHFPGAASRRQKSRIAPLSVGNPPLLAALRR